MHMGRDAVGSGPLVATAAGSGRPVSPPTLVSYQQATTSLI